MMQDMAPEGQRHGRGYDGKASYEDLQTQWILRGVKPQETGVGWLPGPHSPHLETSQLILEARSLTS